MRDLKEIIATDEALCRLVNQTAHIPTEEECQKAHQQDVCSWLADVKGTPGVAHDADCYGRTGIIEALDPKTGDVFFVLDGGGRVQANPRLIWVPKFGRTVAELREVVK